MNRIICMPACDGLKSIATKQAVATPLINTYPLRAIGSAHFVAPGFNPATNGQQASHKTTNPGLSQDLLFKSY